MFLFINNIINRENVYDYINNANIKTKFYHENEMKMKFVARECMHALHAWLTMLSMYSFRNNNNNGMTFQ